MTHLLSGCWPQETSYLSWNTIQFKCKSSLERQKAIKSRDKSRERETINSFIHLIDFLKTFSKLLKLLKLFIIFLIDIRIDPKIIFRVIYCDYCLNCYNIALNWPQSWCAERSMVVMTTESERKANSCWKWRQTLRLKTQMTTSLQINLFSTVKKWETLSL